MSSPHRVHRIVSPRPARLSGAIAQALPEARAQQGFGLLGIIVGLALSAAVVGVAYTAYRANAQASDVSTSTQTTRDLDQRVLAAYASAVDFSGLSTQAAEAEGVIPKSLLKNGQPVDAWGGAIDLTAVNVAGASGPGNNNGFALTFEQVAAVSCSSFATNAGRGFQDVKVNNVSVMSGRQVNTTQAITLCNEGSTDTVQFIQAKVSPNGAQLPTLTPCVPPPDGLQHLNCPVGQLSSVAPYTPVGITQTNHSFCTNPYGAYGTTPWQTVSNTCVPACVAPAPTVTPGAQTASCPAGQVTIAGGSATFPQTNTQTTTYTCPLPVGAYTPIVNPPTAWTPVASSVCAPKCIAPSNTTGSQGVTGTCPAGQVTSSGATTFAQTQTRSVTYACPAPTGAYTTAYGAWSAATPAASSVCAPKCTAPGPSSYPNYQWVSTAPGCPAGQTGSYSYQYQQVQTITTTYSCPAPQGSYTSSASAGGWSNTGATQNVVNTCVTPPPAINYGLYSFQVANGATDYNGQMQWGITDLIDPTLSENYATDTGSECDALLGVAVCVQAQAELRTLLSTGSVNGIYFSGSINLGSGQWVNTFMCDENNAWVTTGYFSNLLVQQMQVEGWSEGGGASFNQWAVCGP